MRDGLTVITNTGERFSIDRDSITGAKILMGTNLYTAYADATTGCTECEVVLFADDVACTNLVAIGLYDPSGYDVQWILSQNPNVFVYTVEVTNCKNEVLDYQVDIDLVRKPTLPKILRDGHETHYTEWSIGTSFSFSSHNIDRHYEIVRIERLGVASLEDAALIEEKNLSDAEILDAIASEYPDMLECIFSFMENCAERKHEELTKESTAE